MFHIVLVEPEIPPNTGNIIRLCANTGAKLHLIHPLGFDFDDRQLRRAGLDYHEFASVQQHDDFDKFVSSSQPEQIYTFSTKGTRTYTEAKFELGAALVFGSETRGLPTALMATQAPENILRLPMLATSRSLNLSNTVAIALYEAWRQNGFILKPSS
jgi:tRNA (cytidine/uridine-2'-O-)-methyltransferase